jgi:hypothetical protein
MTTLHRVPAPCQWFARRAAALDRRSAPRLALLFLGAVLARGRRTVASSAPRSTAAKATATIIRRTVNRTRGSLMAGASRVPRSGLIGGSWPH